MVDLMVGFGRNFHKKGPRGVACRQVKKKFKDLKVGDILLVTKDREFKGFLQIAVPMFSQGEARQAMPRTPFGLQSCMMLDYQVEDYPLVI